MTLLDRPTVREAPSARDSPRVWVEDVHPIFRQGMVSVLQSEGLRIVGESAGMDPDPDPDGIDVLVFTAEVQTIPSVLAWRGIESGPHMVALVPPLANADVVCRMVEAGVDAVLYRSEVSAERLAGTIRSAAAGNVTIPADSMPRLLARASEGSSSTRGLADREVQVLLRLAMGEDTRQVGDSLGYSERTVKNIVHDALMKLNCRNRVHAVAEAIRAGYI